MKYICGAIKDCDNPHDYCAHREPHDYVEDDCCESCGVTGSECVPMTSKKIILIARRSRKEVKQNE